MKKFVVYTSGIEQKLLEILLFTIHFTTQIMAQYVASKDIFITE